MEDRLLFERIHEALDVDARPAGYERMRTALINHSSAPRRRAAFFDLRLNKMGFRLAAIAALVAIAATAAAVFIGTHRYERQNVPAKLDAQAIRYQHMTDSADTALRGSFSNHCNTIDDTGCPAALEHIRVVDQAWLNELAASPPPPTEFATADQQIRKHVAVMMSDIDDAEAAFQARKQDQMVNAINAAGEEAAWLGSMNIAISHSRPAASTDYVASVRGSRLLLEGCSTCQQLAAQSAASCAPNPYPSCDLEVATARDTVLGLQSGDLVLLPPPSFTAKDAKLQADLAAADDAVTALRRALLTGDLATWDSQRAILGRTLSAIHNDITAITG